MMMMMIMMMMICFCGIIDRPKAFSFIFSQNRFRRFSPTQTFKPPAAFEQTQNLRSCIIECTCGFLTFSGGIEMENSAKMG